MEKTTKAKKATKKTTKKATKKVEQMQEIRKTTARSSSGSERWTTGDEIRFLRELPETMQSSKVFDNRPPTAVEIEKAYKSYLSAMSSRINWRGINPDEVRDYCHKLIAENFWA